MLRHLLDIRKKPLVLLRIIHRRKHVPLRRLPQQPLNHHLPLRQRARALPKPLRLRLRINPPPRTQNLRLIPLLIRPLQRRNNLIPILPLQHPWSNQHLLIMPQHALRIYLPIIEVRNRSRVNPHGELQRRERQSVFKPRYQVRLPA